jgi:hypothetical protein
MNDPHKGQRYLKGVVSKVKDQVGGKKEAYRHYVLTGVMNLVIQADKDESGEFDHRKIKHLILYIKAPPSVSVNEKKFAKAIKREPSLVLVLAFLVQDLGTRRDNIIPRNASLHLIELQVMATSKKHESKAPRKK